ncbi:MAG TPA: metallophosphoesterase [Pirellulales bacterium]|nr:metallophosphoesterase [Pirellulales bacterium]
METFLYNTAMALVLATALWVVRRHRTAAGAVAAGCGLVSLACLLAIGLGGQRFSGVRLLAYGLFLHTGLLLAGVAIILRNRSRPFAIAAATACLLLELVAADSFLVEPHWIEVTHVQIASPKLSRPLRMAIVADLQTDSVGEYERRALELVLREQPDLIVMAGDYIQEWNDGRRAAQQERLRSVLRQIDFRAPLGVYAVRGNADAPDWEKAFAQTEVTTLDATGSVDVGELRITGLAMSDSFLTSLRIDPSERFQIVVGHAPDFALGEIHAELLVAGHTHGGQVRLPWLGPIMTQSEVPRSWAAGVTQLGHDKKLGHDKTLIVSRGIGMERAAAPRIRFLCRPQIVVVDLVPVGQVSNLP